MSSKQSRSETSLAILFARLDEIQMSAYERQRAKARLAQADAIAGMLVDAVRGIRRFLKNLFIRPIRRRIASAG